ncbi:MAG: hypothetical protein WBB28_27100 [Crinalium sp.]
MKSRKAGLFIYSHGQWQRGWWPVTSKPRLSPVVQKIHRSLVEGYQPQTKYCVTAVYEGKRQVRFKELSAEQAEFWLRWIERNEPNTDPRVEISFQLSEA